jgi:septal ring factor EnvC (AmiA/AmiB activator)
MPGVDMLHRCFFTSLMLVMVMFGASACAENSATASAARQAEQRFAQLEQEIAALRQELATIQKAEATTAATVIKLEDKISILEKRVGDLRTQILKLLNKRN